MIGFYAVFELASHNNNIHKGAAIWVLPNYVSGKIANALNSRVCATDKSSSISASVRNVENRFRKLLQSYPDEVTYFLKTFVTDQATAKFYAAILRYMQPAYMKPQQYAHDLVANTCIVADVYDEYTLNVVFTEGVDPSIRHSPRHFWAQNPQADLTDNTFQAESLLFIQKGVTIMSTTNQNTRSQGKTHNRKPWNNHYSANIVSSDTTKTSTRCSRHRPKSPPVLCVHKPDRQASVTGSKPGFSSSMPSFSPLSFEVCYDPVLLMQKYTLLAQDFFLTVGDHRF